MSATPCFQETNKWDKRRLTTPHASSLALACDQPARWSLAKESLYLTDWPRVVLVASGVEPVGDVRYWSTVQSYTPYGCGVAPETDPKTSSNADFGRTRGSGEGMQTYQLPGLNGTPGHGHGLTRSRHAELCVCVAGRHG